MRRPSIRKGLLGIATAAGDWMQVAGEPTTQGFL